LHNFVCVLLQSIIKAIGKAVELWEPHWQLQIEELIYRAWKGCETTACSSTFPERRTITDA
jgi:hypothetical protein